MHPSLEELTARISERITRLRSLGPKYETRRWNRPNVSEAREFLELYRSAKQDCCRVILCDPTSQAAHTWLRELEEFGSYFAHPKTRARLSPKFHQLAYYAQQFNVPMSQRREFIRGKINIVQDGTATEADHLLFEATVEQLLDSCASETKTYVGETVGDALAKVTQDPSVSAERLVSLRIVPQQNAWEVEAWTEEESKDKTLTATPAGSIVEKVTCLRQPTQGFLGLGKKIGRWAVTYSRPATVEVKYVSW